MWWGETERVQKFRGMCQGRSICETLKQRLNLYKKTWIKNWRVWKEEVSANRYLCSWVETDVSERVGSFCVTVCHSTEGLAATVSPAWECLRAGKLFLPLWAFQFPKSLPSKALLSFRPGLHGCFQYLHLFQSQLVFLLQNLHLHASLVILHLCLCILYKGISKRLWRRKLKVYFE